MSLKVKIKAAPYWAYATVFGKVPFRDRFGLRYYLWKDTRLADTVMKKVRTDDTGVLHQLFLIIDALRQTKSTLTCVDVGAFIGGISIAMASRVGVGGRVFSFEPNPANRLRIEQNVQLNGFTNVFVQPFGVSNIRDTNVDFQIMDSPGEGFVLGAVEDDVPTPPKGASQVKIDLETLEHFSREHSIDKIDVLKIDAEGVDDKVLVGAGELLKSGNISFAFCEYNPGAKAGQRCLSLLEEHRFAILYIVRNDRYLVRDLNRYPHQSHKPPLNLLAISPNAPVFVNGKGLDIRG